MTTPIWHGWIEKGWPNFHNDSVDKMCAFFAGMEGKKITMVVERESKKRSLNQNAYYWGIVIKMIADRGGYRGRKELFGIHEQMREYFLKIVLFGDAYVLSTTALNTVKFEEYCAKIRQWAAIAIDVQIPLPNECVIPDQYEEGEPE